jgi:hypothetical protein
MGTDDSASGGGTSAGQAQERRELVRSDEDDGRLGRRLGERLQLVGRGEGPEADHQRFVRIDGAAAYAHERVVAGMADRGQRSRGGRNEGLVGQHGRPCGVKGIQDAAQGRRPVTAGRDEVLEASARRGERVVGDAAGATHVRLDEGRHRLVHRPGDEDAFGLTREFAEERGKVVARTREQIARIDQDECRHPPRA